ncbi:transcriptional regulator [Streptomyces mirabilis]|uniref:MmyB family transcriptional regulator n=1 Tax=Streptomyces mirabilis TaxID=68239 RepID=UPI00364A6CC7
MSRHLDHDAGSIPDDLDRLLDLADVLDVLPDPRDWGETDVSQQLLQLMDGWDHTPAFVVDPALDIMAGNSLATALHSGFDRFDNLASMVFVDPGGREFYQEWERAAHSCVAEIRGAYGHDPESARIAEVVAELCAQSEEFAEIWQIHEVKSKSQEGKHLKHPQVGDLHIKFAAFTVNGAPELATGGLSSRTGQPDGGRLREAEGPGRPGEAGVPVADLAVNEQ